MVSEGADDTGVCPSVASVCMYVSVRPSALQSPAVVIESLGAEPAPCFIHRGRGVRECVCIPLAGI